jgi:hypothetical protein
MALTFADILDKLLRIDEVSLLEILEISSEDLVERFEDKIKEKLHVFEEDLEDEY